MREHIALVLNHPVCDILLQQPWETNTLPDVTRLVHGKPDLTAGSAASHTRPALAQHTDPLPGVTGV